MTFTFQAPVLLFHVVDVPTSVRFYRDILLFEVVSTEDHREEPSGGATWAMLRAGDVTVMLQAAYPKIDAPLVPDSSRNLWHADTVLYLICTDLAALCSHLRQRGVATEKGSPVFRNMDEVFLQDPDGYTLCFHRPSPIFGQA